jgi:hypothetical protein
VLSAAKGAARYSRLLAAAPVEICHEWDHIRRYYRGHHRGRLDGKNTGGRLRPTRQEIARLAYQRYESNGRKDGNDMEDWLRAEQELTHHYV